METTTPFSPLRSPPLPLRSLSSAHIPILSLPSIPILRRHRRRLLSVAAAFRQDLTTWTPTSLSWVSPVSDDSSLFHIVVDLSSVPNLAGAFTAAGEYIQIWIPSAEKLSFIVIASTPEDVVKRGEFEFLVKKITGSTAKGICGMRSGDLVDIRGLRDRDYSYHVAARNAKVRESRSKIETTISGLFPSKLDGFINNRCLISVNLRRPLAEAQWRERDIVYGATNCTFHVFCFATGREASFLAYHLKIFLTD